MTATAAVIDVGSNSVLLLVVAVEEGGAARAVDEALATTRLGAGLRRRRKLAPDARARTVEAVVALAARARRAGARQVRGFATAALRDAIDGKAFASKLASAAGIPVEVLCGEREARLAYAAVRDGLRLDDGPLLVADVGGRTTELTLGRGDAIDGAASLPLGALALTEAHGDDRAGLAAFVDRVLAGCDLVGRARRLGVPLAASGGTATALAALDLDLRRYEPRRVHGHVLSTQDLAVLPVADRLRRASLDAGRAALLPAGAALLARLAAAAGATRVTVSDHAVRHAYLRETLARDGVPADFRALWR